MLMICAILLPILSGALLPLFRFTNRRAREIYVEAFVLCTSVLSAFLLFTQGDEAFTLFALTPSMHVAFHLDGLGRVFTGIVAFLWPLASLYAFEYMEHEGGENTFFAFYTMTYGVTLGISMAANYETLYLFYELLTLVTLPLVCHSADSKSMAAGRKYIYYSLAGAAMAFVGLMFILSYGSCSDFVLGGVLEGAGHETLLRIVFVISFLGFGVKAAVFPFHGWLPEASVAPTPVTALLHAVAVVKAGVFAIMRISFYSFGPALLKGTFAQYIPLALAAFTIVYGSSMAVKERHIKRRLAYSTVSNLSYILFGVMLLTASGLSAALMHMVFHALMKIILFFCAGAIMVKAEKHYVQEIRGFGKVMPFTFAVFTLGALALIGVPPLAGFISKWHLALAAFDAGGVLPVIGVCALLVSAVLTGIYTMGIALPAYTLPLAPENEALGNRDPGLRMKVPFVLLVLALLAVSLYAQPLLTYLTSVPHGLM